MKIEELIRPDMPQNPPFTVSQKKPIAKMDQNESPFDLPDNLKQNILNELLKMNWNRYPQPKTYYEIKEIFSETINIPPKYFALTTGCDQAIQGAHLIVGGKGRRALVFEPTYPMLWHAGLFSGTSVKRIFIGPEYLIDKKMLDDNFNLILIASPNNPTGNFIDDDIIEYALKKPSVLFLDEAYYDISKKTLVDWIQEYPNLIIGRSCSKAQLAGIRLGYFIAKPKLVSILENLLTAPYHLSHLQLIIAKLFHKIKPFINSFIEIIINEREKVINSLNELNIKTYPSNTNFVMFEIDNPNYIYNKLIEKGIRLRNLTQIKGLSRHLRVTIGKPEENNYFIETLKTLI